VAAAASAVATQLSSLPVADMHHLYQPLLLLVKMMIMTTTTAVAAAGLDTVADFVRVCVSFDRGGCCCRFCHCKFSVCFLHHDVVIADDVVVGACYGLYLSVLASVSFYR
jgi:hypothetical protein